MIRDGTPRWITIRNYALLIAFCVLVGIGIGAGNARTAPFDLLPTMMRGVAITIQLTLTAAVLAFFVALIAGIGRLSKNWFIRAITSVYIEIFRGTSVLVQMFWIFFVLPLPPFNLSLTAFQAGVLALGLNVGAYGAEVVRGAVQAVPRGQVEASIALNMPPMMRMRRVILPQAMVRMLPPFGNLLIELLKATSLVSLITLSDVTFQALTLRQSVGRTNELFILLLIIYFVIAYPLTLAVRWLESRVEWAKA